MQGGAQLLSPVLSQASTGPSSGAPDPLLSKAPVAWSFSFSLSQFWVGQISRVPSEECAGGSHTPVKVRSLA